MKLIYHVESSGDWSAGLLQYSDQVTVEIESGDPGGDDGEFAEELRQFLAEWYDGADVWLSRCTCEDYPTHCANDCPEHPAEHPCG